MELYLVQMAIARGKPELNRAKVLALTSGIKPGGHALIVLPELFSTGFLDDSALRTAGSGHGAGSPEWARIAAEDRLFLAALARSTGCWVAGTTVESGPSGPDGNGGFRNLSLFYSPEGAESGQYRKIHPFSYGGEDRLFAPGNEIVTLEAGGWVLQPTICYDLRFPELYRAGSRRGVHLILVQANWPQARQAHWEALLKARAIENQAYVAGVNCTGSQDSLRFAGGSAILSPKGETLALGDDSECMVRGRADLDQCKQWRKQFPALRDRRPWEFYGP